MENDRRKKAAEEVLRWSRNNLYLELRFLEQALFRLIPEDSEQIFMGSDGKKLYYKKAYLLNRYLQSPEDVICDYLHIVIHCLYQHPLQACQHDSRYWNLASDIAVADVMGEMELPSIADRLPRECFAAAARIKEEVTLMSATHITRYLQQVFSDKEQLCGRTFEELETLFCRDDHSCWHYIRKEPAQSDLAPSTNDMPDSSDSKHLQEKDSNAEEQQDKYTEEPESGETLSWIKESQALSEQWKDIAENVMFSIQNFSREQGTLPDSMIQNLQKLTRETYDYTEFLRKFAIMNERLKVNLDEFDYIYYLYGLRTLKKIPLIEPLEYKEEYQVREFAIAIDTSGSCSGELVQKFLNKTYNILKQTEHFASQVVLHIIQCDAALQEDVKITSLANLEEYMEHMELKGFGGTDFRPVFEYVDKLCREHEFTRLYGLIYFTDGLGIFPEKPPAYKTAFVFVERDDCVKVPPWAMKLYLDNDI